jgi:hypothetical protein
MAAVVAQPSLEKLSRLLSWHPDVPTILLCHSPLTVRYTPDNAVQVMQVVERCSNVVAMLCGHDHAGFWNTTNGVLQACVPGFCEGYNGSLYSFVLWHVYADRLLGRVYQVEDSGRVTPFERLAGYKADQITEIAHTLPARFRLRPGTDPAPWRVLPLPQADAPLLETWFGRDWTYAPGVALPPSWRDDVLLVATQAPRKALVRMTEPGGRMQPDADGKPWFAPDYRPDAAWEACAIPDEYWDSRSPRKGGRRYYRIAFKADPADLGRARRGALKALYYKNPEAYLNGKPLRLVGGFMHAKYWNGMDMFPPDLLVPGDNVLALAISTSGWGGYKLDVELSLQSGEAHAAATPP